MTAPAIDLDALLAALAARLAPLVARELAATATAAEPEFYTSAGPLPPGMSRRAFLDHARRGSFPTSKRGKVVYAARADVAAWVAGGRRAAPANDTTGTADLTALAAASVARSVGGKR